MAYTGFSGTKWCELPCVAQPLVRTPCSVGVLVHRKSSTKMSDHTFHKYIWLSLPSAKSEHIWLIQTLKANLEKEIHAVAYQVSAVDGTNSHFMRLIFFFMFLKRPAVFEPWGEERYKGSNQESYSRMTMLSSQPTMHWSPPPAHSVRGFISAYLHNCAGDSNAF